ncbi:Uncharacterised protein [Helicobacter pylori]|uniref:Uncharacterized protein n=1 Tax=Helicobacter pylori TaxID=210 RepID=A0A377S0G5_HELPX|nr:Uncharacterised protein [Helicobacter pylori]
MAFKPFKKGLGVYFQKGFVFFVFSYFYKELKMDKQKVKTPRALLYHDFINQCNFYAFRA